MKKVFRNLISSNMLKTIAVIAMVVDHIGFYFSDTLDKNVYDILRNIGRIAMPLFVYLLVQGFFYTRNFKKYILRVGITGVITQIIITILMIINIKYYPEYNSAKLVNSIGNILFTFVLCLILMKVLHESVLIKKWDYSKNLSLRIILVIMIYTCGILVPIDYGYIAPTLCTLLYFIERLKTKLLIDRSSNKNTLSNLALKMVNDNTIEAVYVLLILVSLIIVYLGFKTNIAVVLASIPIALYNGKKGKSNNFVKYIYYIIFPLQHAILYILAMLT